MQSIAMQVRAVGSDMSPSRQIPDDAFLFTAEVSNTRLDSYYTHFDRSSLENFEAAAKIGVVLLDSHDGRKLGVGYSAGGRLIDGEDGEARLEVLFYIVPEITLGGIHSYATTDDYIKAIESEIVRDVSVGFVGGRWVCDICGKDYFRGRCPHLLGLDYQIDLGEGPVTIKTATVTIFDAELSEVSLVFDGATPGAEIIEKANQQITAGALADVDRMHLETVYRHKLDDPGLPGKKSTVTAVEGVNMGNKDNREIEAAEVDETEVTEIEETEVIEDVEVDETETAEADEVAEVDETEITDEVETEPEIEPVDDLTDDDPAEDVIRAASTRSVAIAEAVAGAVGMADAMRAIADLAVSQQREIERMVPLAEMGEQYRADLIDQVCREGVRAQGAEFPEPTYRVMLENAGIDHIKEVLSSFEGSANDRYPGGRISEDRQIVESGESAAQDQPEVPATAYGA